MSVIESQRKETPFSVRDNMLDIWKQITELTFRGFGKKKRKMPKTPSNFQRWSQESQKRWRIETAEKHAQAEAWDMNFITTESRVVDNLCRKIVYLIDQANTINPQYLCECDKQRLLQDEAIGLCHKLQKNGEQLGNLVTAHATLAEAEAKYHSVLAAAAVSNIEAHSCILVNAYGIPIKNECYRHGAEAE